MHSLPPPAMRAQRNCNARCGYRQVWGMVWVSSSSSSTWTEGQLGTHCPTSTMAITHNSSPPAPQCQRVLVRQCIDKALQRARHDLRPCRHQYVRRRGGRPGVHSAVSGVWRSTYGSFVTSTICAPQIGREASKAPAGSAWKMKAQSLQQKI